MCIHADLHQKAQKIRCGTELWLLEVYCAIIKIVLWLNFGMISDAQNSMVISKFWKCFNNYYVIISWTP